MDKSVCRQLARWCQLCHCKYNREVVVGTVNWRGKNKCLTHFVCKWRRHTSYLTGIGILEFNDDHWICRFDFRQNFTSEWTRLGWINGEQCYTPSYPTCVIPRINFCLTHKKSSKCSTGLQHPVLCLWIVFRRQTHRCPNGMTDNLPNMYNELGIIEKNDID